MLNGPDELIISRFVFDDWWTSTYLDRLTPLLPQEIEVLVMHHWKELQATAIRHSMRELKRELGCTCKASDSSPANLHMKNCPVYQQAG